MNVAKTLNTILKHIPITVVVKFGIVGIFNFEIFLFSFPYKIDLFKLVVKFNVVFR